MINKNIFLITALLLTSCSYASLQTVPGGPSLPAQDDDLSTDNVPNKPAQPNSPKVKSKHEQEGFVYELSDAQKKEFTKKFTGHEIFWDLHCITFCPQTQLKPCECKWKHVKDCAFDVSVRLPFIWKYFLGNCNGICDDKTKNEAQLYKEHRSQLITAALSAMIKEGKLKCNSAGASGCSGLSSMLTQDSIKDAILIYHSTRRTFSGGL